MTVEIKLYKRTGTYEKDGKEKPFTNFYIGVNDKLIPVEVKYFPNAAFQNRDPGYQGRVAALDVVAELLPEITNKDKAPDINPRKVTCPTCKEIMRVEDEDGISFHLACDKCKISGFVDTKNGEISFKDADGNEIST